MMLSLKSFMVIILAGLVMTSCGQTSSQNSKLDGNAPSVSDCQGNVGRKIDGTNTYYRYLAATTGEQATASKGKITGCWYPSDAEAKTEVKNTCSRGGTANCDAESSWQRETISLTLNLSGVMQPAEPAPAAGGCYQKIASNYNIVCRDKGSKSDCDYLHWAGCGWAEPKDADNDGIPDVRDMCPSVKETMNGVRDDDGCPDQLADMSWESMNANLDSVSVALDGTVWGRGAGNDFRLFRFTGSSWEVMPGSLSQVAVGSANHIWALGLQGEVYRWANVSRSWEFMNGTLGQIDVGADGTVWGRGVGSDTRIFRYTGSGWEVMPGNLSQVAVGNANNIWAIGLQGEVYRWASGSNSWEYMNAKLGQIDVGADGSVWGRGFGSDARIFKFSANAWEVGAGVLKQISVGNDKNIWSVGLAGEVYRKPR